MKNKYQIVTYTKVKKFIDNLSAAQKARIDRLYDLFEEYGHSLPTRYLKKVAEDVWELRPGDVRLFLTIEGGKAIVVHGIKKKSRKIPKKDLDLAIRRVREIV